MIDENNIKQFTATDIEKYHNGQLSAKEMHALEKAALDDPFLADALEGYAVAGVDVKADIAELKNRLAQKTEETKVIPLHGGNSSFPWLRAAVIIVVLLTAGLFSYQFFFKKDSNPISQLNENKNSVAKPADKSAAPSPTGSLADSITPGIESNATINLPVTNSNTASGDINIKTDIKTDHFLNVTTDTVRVGEISNYGSVLTPEKVAPVTTIPAPIEDQKAKERKDLAIQGKVSGITVDQKNEADKVMDDAQLREQFSYKSKADSTNLAMKRQAAKPNANAVVVGYGTAGQNQQGFYRNNSTNIFRGQIIDANNIPLPFANVTNTRDNVGTYTDAKGYFVLVSPDSVMEVQVKSLGYEYSKVRLRGNLPNNTVTLQEDKSLSARILDTAKRNYRSRDGNLALEEPEPADGWSSYDSYLANNQNDVPEAFDIKKNSGSDAVELSFEINKNGEPVNIRVEKSLCDKCDKEAIRLVKEGPKWKRKAKKGKRTTVTVPFIKTE